METVVVLAGGLSHERDVSLGSVAGGPGSARRRLRVVESDVDSGLLCRLAEHPGAVVFPVLHGEAGEDGSLREVLALLGVPFVGSVGAACRVAFDKSVATTWWRPRPAYARRSRSPCPTRSSASWAPPHWSRRWATRLVFR